MPGDYYNWPPAVYQGNVGYYSSNGTVLPYIDYAPDTPLWYDKTSIAIKPMQPIDFNIKTDVNFLDPRFIPTGEPVWFVERD
jgi:hypothetical protein